MNSRQAAVSGGAPRWTVAARDAALGRVKKAAGDKAVVSLHKATGAARFLRAKGPNGSLRPGLAKTDAEKQQQVLGFLRENGAAIGVTDPAILRLERSKQDRLGETHLTWKQFHGSVPVFGATLKTHFDADGRLKAITGTVLPNLTAGETPTRTSTEASSAAVRSVVAERGSRDGLHVGSSRLVVFRTGLTTGVPGEDHLAWEIEVTDGAGVRDFVYVDAVSNKVVSRITAVHDDLDRRAYDGKNLPRVPDNYPNGPYWEEGERFPTNSDEANNMIISSKEVYDLFNGAFGRDSFDGQGATMDAIFDRGYSCPNASWNGTFISFCPGTTTDDVTAHEWGHAYTQYTHGLIYEWQPGALNESYSDIWGEVVDFVNGRGTDSPAGFRASGSACSSFSPPVGRLRINSPSDIAASYFAQSAAFGPPLDTTGITGDVVIALDPGDAAGPSTTDGCSTIVTDLSGKIALIDRGSCEFSRKVLNAQNRGARGVIIANNVSTGLPGMGAGVDAPSVTIPSLGVQQSTGNTLRGKLNAGSAVDATLLAQPGSDVSLRWLVGEDAAAFDGALRDMWNPTCYSNPGKVSDSAFYVCAAVDNGGVHTNSGVPNHGFALLVDGGSYNGQTVSGIGLTKAAHIYFRAQDAYQVDDTDFADHADALEASCQDLVGKPLAALAGGPGEVMLAGDCAQVTAMIAAVELRTPPSFCNFAGLLNPGLPALCSAATTSGTATPIAGFDFEGGASGFEATHTASAASFTPRDWSVVNQLPSPRTGSAFFGPDPDAGTCTAADDQSGVLHLTSPEIALPASTAFARATFDHWFALEPGFDGGNLSVSVNGGPFQLIPPGEITFNNYIAFLFTADDGNTNPLAGQPAWTGTNPGSVKGGSWGRTHLNLGNFARAGDRVRLRWDLGTDQCGGRVGWYLDNVNLFSCTPNVPDLTVADISVVEGNAGRSNAVFTVRMTRPTIRPVAVAYLTEDGTAQHGNDFERAENTLVIPAGATSGQIAIEVKGDGVAEGDEVFTLRLVAANGGTIVDGEAQATIVDDD